MAIRLPSLEQDVDIDYSDLGRAERAAAQFERNMNRSLKGLDTKKAQKDLHDIGEAARGAEPHFRSFSQGMRLISAAVSPAAISGLSKASLTAGAMAGKFGLMGALATQAAAGVGGLSSALAPLVPLGLTVPAGLFAIKGALGIVGAALKSEQLKKPLADIKKSFDNMIGKDTAPAFLRFFDAFKSRLSGISTAIKPMTGAVSGVVDKFTQLVKSGSFMERLTKIAASSGVQIKNWGSSLFSVVDGFLSLAEAGGPAMEKITAGAAKVTRSFQDWTASGLKSGQLAAQMENARKRASELVGVIGSIFRGLAGIGKVLGASGIGDTVFDKLKDGGEAVQNFSTKYAQSIDAVAQNGKKLVEGIGGPLSQIARTILDLGGKVNIAPLFKPLTETLRQAGQLIAPLANGLVGGITGILNGVNSVLGPLRNSAVIIGDTFTALGGIAGTLIGQLAPAFNSVIPTISGFVRNVGGTLTKVVPDLTGPLAQIVRSTGEMFGRLLALVEPFVARFAQPIANAFTLVQTGIGNVAEGVSGPLLNTVDQVLPSLVEAFDRVVPAVESLAIAAGSLLESFGPSFGGAINTAVNVIVPLLGMLTQLSDLASKLPEPVQALVTTLLSLRLLRGLPVIGKLFEGIGEKGTSGIQRGVDAIKEKFNGLRGAVTSGAPAITSAAAAVGTGVAAGVKGASDAVSVSSDTVKARLEEIRRSFDGTGTIANDARDGIRGAMAGVDDAVKSTGAKMSSNFQYISAALDDNGTKAEGFGSRLRGVFDRTVARSQLFAMSITDTMGKVGGLLSRSGSAPAVAQGGGPGAARPEAGVFSKLADSAKATGGDIRGAFVEIGQNLKEFIGQPVAEVGKSLPAKLGGGLSAVRSKFGEVTSSLRDGFSKIREGGLSSFGAIPEAASKAAGGIRGAWQTVTSDARAMFQGFPSIFGSMTEAAAEASHGTETELNRVPATADSTIGKVKGAVTGIAGAFGGLKGAASETESVVKQAFDAIPIGLGDTVDATDEAATGVDEAVAPLDEAVNGVVDKVVAGFEGLGEGASDSERKTSDSVRRIPASVGAATTATTGHLGRFRTAVSGIGTSVARVATVIGGGLMKGLGGLVGFLGGPWGIALTGATLLMSLFGQSQQKAQQDAADYKAEVESLAGTLDKINQESGPSNRTAIFDSLRDAELPHRVEELGTSMGAVVAAIATGGDAAANLRAQMTAIEVSNLAAKPDIIASWHKQGAAYEAAGISLHDFISAVQQGPDALEAMRSKVEGVGDGTLRVSDYLVNLIGTQDRYMSAALADYDEAVQKQEAAKKLSDALFAGTVENAYTSASALGSVTPTVDDLSKALRKSYTEQTSVTSALKGIGIVGPQAAAILSELGGYYDSTSGKLVGYSDDTLKVQQAILAVAKSANEGIPNATQLAAAYKVLGDDAASAADKSNALGAALDLMNHVDRGKEQTEFSWQKNLRDIPTELERINKMAGDAGGGIEKAFEAGGNAVSKLTDEGAALNDFMNNLRGGYAAVVDSTYESVKATDGQEAAIQAATKAAVDQRKAFIDAATAVGISSTRAEALATAYGLIPENVRTTLSLDGSSEVVKTQVAGVIASIAAVPDTKTVTFKPGEQTDETLRMVEKLGYTVTHMPDGTVTISGNAVTANLEVQKLKDKVATLQNDHGQIVIDSNTTTEEALQRLKDLGYQVDAVADQPGKLVITDTIAHSKSKIEDLAKQVLSLPNHQITITAPTEKQKIALQALGLTVTEIPGTKDVKVSVTDSGIPAVRTNLGIISQPLNTTLTITYLSDDVSKEVNELQAKIGVQSDGMKGKLIIDSSTTTVAARKHLEELGYKISELEGQPGKIVIEDDIPDEKRRLLDLAETIADTPDKEVNIGVPTDKQKAALMALGVTIRTMPDGSSTVSVSQQGAAAVKAAIIDAAQDRDAFINVSTKGLAGAINSINVAVSGVQRAVLTAAGVAQAQGGYLQPMANGGLLGNQGPLRRPVRAFAAGARTDFHNAKHLNGKYATVIPANSLRVIGDNMQFPELFAPLDPNSQRSKGLVAQGANTIGLGVYPLGMNKQQLAKYFGFIPNALGSIRTSSPAKAAPTLTPGFSVPVQQPAGPTIQITQINPQIRNELDMVHEALQMVTAMGLR